MTSAPEDAADGSILITEDHVQTAALIGGVLAAELRGCRITTVASGEEALEYCRATPPRVVIMDISLPGMNGIEATRRIKAVAPDVQIVMHSNLDPAIYMVDCVIAGASAYVRKARPRAELLPVVARLLFT